MKSIDLDDICQRFLLELYGRTDGESSAQVSMYDIGSTLDLDRDEASRVAEELIGWELADIRTLSGGIGISPGGIEKAQLLTGAPNSSEKNGFTLGDDPVLTDTDRKKIEKFTHELKGQVGSLELSFEALDEFMIDIKTIDPDGSLCGFNKSSEYIE